jgi:hypothetical protein
MTKRTISSASSNRIAKTQRQPTWEEAQATILAS